jgi:ribosomal protein L1
MRIIVFRWNLLYCIFLQNRYLDAFTRIVSVPHPFDTGSARSVLVFCKSTELQKSALEAGATVAGGTELIKNVQVINTWVLETVIL